MSDPKPCSGVQFSLVSLVSATVASPVCWSLQSRAAVGLSQCGQHSGSPTGTVVGAPE